MPADVVDVPYLLITILPYFEDEAGAVWIDRLWHKDLVAHLGYLPKLVVAAPLWPTRPPGDLVRVDDSRARFVPLPAMRSLVEGVVRLPALVGALWQAVGGVEVVHSGVVGWPFPVGWIANPIALARNKRLVLVVESAPWRASPDTSSKWARRLRGRVTERLARTFVNRGDVVFFTHAGYRDSLLQRGGRRGHVIPATWIDDDAVLSDDAARASWDAKSAGPVRVLFAGRLVADKGVHVLLDAARRLRERGAHVQIDVIGEGPLADAVRASGCPLLPSVPYGPAFFALVRGYHAVVVPTISDEQPRILYDAAAQAVPVVATDSTGNRAFVVPGDNGLLVPANDVDALADALTTPAATLRAFGLRALDRVRGSTHRAMHDARARILADALA